MAKDWTKLYKKYRGQWVALGTDEQTVVASGATVREVTAAVKRKGAGDVFFTRIPDNLEAFVG